MSGYVEDLKLLARIADLEVLGRRFYLEASGRGSHP